MHRTFTLSNPLNSFGSIMEGRSYEGDTSLGYRFGFNGKEKDDETHGGGNELDYGERIYDSRLGRWMSIDPLFKKYASLSPYNFAGNSPIVMKDIEGEKIYIYYYTGKTDSDGKPIIGSYEYGSGLKLPNNKFVRQSIRTLRRIERSGKDPMGIINTLENATDVNVAILKGTWNRSSANIIVSQGTRTFGDKTEQIGDLPDIIGWHPNAGLIGSDGKGRQSAANGLLHELAHSYYEALDPEGHVAEYNRILKIENLDERTKALNDYDKKEAEEVGAYGNYADKWIIENIESKFGETKRKSHKDGYFLKTIGGTFSKIGFRVARFGKTGTVGELKRGNGLKRK